MAMWTWLIPALSSLLLIVAVTAGVGSLLAVVGAAALLGSVFVAVHHAEVVAHRVGEPFGTLVLAVAVTVIEASLILSMIFAGGEDKNVLPRDTIFAAVMIICNGVVGVCVLVGGLAHREQLFRRIRGITALSAEIEPKSTPAVVEFERCSQDRTPWIAGASPGISRDPHATVMHGGVFYAEIWSA